MLCGLARIAFLEALQDEVPQVLRSLAKGPLQSAKDSVPFEEVADWALTFNLAVDGKPAEWVTAIAHTTIRSWLRNPSRAKRLPLEWSGFSLSKAEFSGLSIAEEDVHIPPLRFSPLVDRWEQVEATALDHLQREHTRIRHLAVRNGLQPTTEIRNGEHFEWAARYQCGLEEVEDIIASLSPVRDAVAADSADISTVRKAVDKILKIMGLTKRPTRK
jgi:hypothetical protein